MSTHEPEPTITDSPAPSTEGQKTPIRGVVINVVLAVAIVLSVLWLPPLSLGRRLAEGGYTALGEGTWSVVDPDGTQFSVLPESLSGSLKAKLTTIPRAELLDGTAGEELLAAVESIPSFLDIRSPLYQLALRGTSPGEALLTIPIPNDSLPYETLDVYAWTGETWSWLPCDVIATEDVVLCAMSQPPEQLALVVAQTRPLPPVISAELTGASAPDAANAIVVELNPRGLTLGDEGQILGEAALQIDPAMSFSICPILSNVNSDGSIRSDLVDNMLADAGLRQTHVERIVETVSERGYHGIELDYRAMDPDLRDTFTEFASQLASELHARGKVLSVRVELPRQASYEEWETGVYDWQRLGQAVDVLKVPALPDPQSYVTDGKMEQLIRWAVTQVNRQHLQFILSTHSVDLRGSNPRYLPYEEAMAPFTKVQVQGQRDAFQAEEQVVFDLTAGDGSTSIMFDEGANTYWFRYRDARGEEHTVWLENAASIAHKLRMLAKYNLGGAAFAYLLDAGIDSQVWQVVREYHTRTIPEMRDPFAVVWTVTDGDGGQVESLITALTDPRLVWVAPEQAGQYTVIAGLSSDNGQSATVQGQVVVEVNEPVAEATPTPTATPTRRETQATPTPTPTPTQQVAEAKPEAVVTNSLLNVRAGPGTNYARVGQVRQGTKLEIVGRNAEETWIAVVTPEGAEAWIILTYVSINVSVRDLPLIEAPPAPTPQPTRSSPAPAPAPRGTGFGYGVQAHFDTARVAGAVRDMGFGWIKQQVRWEYSEVEKGKRAWGDLDALADTASASGVKVLFSVVAAPAWARGGKSGIGPPDNYQDFWNFMGAMAAHFKGRVQAYEIWNEQNLSREWEGAPLSAADYVRLLKGAYQAIKAADPGAIVVSGAPTPTGISDGVWAIDDRVYLQQMYNAGLRYYCDAVGAHPSGYANPPDVRFMGGDFDPSRGFDDHPSFFFRNTMEDYYGVMAANGDGGKRIWATEFGWPTTDGMGVSASPGYEFANDINEQQQADYLVRAYTWARNWGRAGVMFLWNLNFWPTAGAENEMAKYGIVRGDWSPRPAYIALRNMPK